MEVKIEEMPAMHVVFTRHVGPYDKCGEAWSRLYSWAGPRGLVGPGALPVGVSYDDPEVTPPEKIRYDACLTISRDVEAEGEFGVQDIAGGKYARTQHRGSYAKLGETYARLCGEWLPANGHEVRAAPCLEIYRNHPQNTPEEDLLTDVYVPVEA